MADRHLLLPAPLESEAGDKSLSVLRNPTQAVTIRNQVHMIAGSDDCCASLGELSRCEPWQPLYFRSKRDELWVIRENVIHNSCHVATAYDRTFLRLRPVPAWKLPLLFSPHHITQGSQAACL